MESSLRERFPLSRPTTVEVVDEIPDDTDNPDARIHLVKNRFAIHVRRRGCVECMVESLIHEWAHGVTWFVGEREDHGPHFWVAYGRISNEVRNWI